MQGFLEGKRYPILNTYVDALSMDETVAAVRQIIEKRIPTQHVVINASKVNLMEKDVKIRNIVNSCPIINADGMSIVWAARFLGVPVRERITGIDLFLKLVAVAAESHYKIFLLGATKEVVAKVTSILRRQYPDLLITGARDGYFKEDEEIADQIRRSGADILFVAFSSPKKEYWIHQHLKQMEVPFVMGVGGSFDVVAGKTNRAPVWMQRFGLEWFFRLMQEPGRMWRRYIIGNLSFAALTCKYKFKQRK